MKLFDCLVDGYFCGLTTPEECIANVELHYDAYFTYDEMEEEFKELFREYKEFTEGTLVIDFDEVRKRQKALQEEYLEWSLGLD